MIKTKTQIILLVSLLKTVTTHNKHDSTCNPPYSFISKIKKIIDTSIEQINIER